MRRTAGSIEFGEYRLDPQAGQLWRGKHTVELQARPFAVLQYLVQRPGAVITKEELLQGVWTDTYVTRTALKVCIRAIREALGDSVQQPRYVETVGREGYRFIGLQEESQPDGMQSSAATLVGRVSELSQLHARLKTVLSGTRQVVFITGEAGIGKTTLVDQFIAEVQTNQSVWIGRGQCVEQYGEGEAYLPFLEALGQLFDESRGARLRAVLHQQAPTWLAQLPVFLSEVEREALQRQVQATTKERMLREMVAALDVLASDQPLLLIFEDLHWSDASTLELLSYVAQRRHPAQLMIVGTYRPTDIIVRQHALQEVIQELLAKGMCAEFPLELLTQEHVTEYVAEHLGVQLDTIHIGKLVHQRTEGNALFMVNVVEQLVEEVDADSAEVQAGLGSIEKVIHAIPSGLRQLIDKQMGRLSAPHKRLLEVASVVGSEFTSASVAAGLRRDIDEIDDWCEELASRGEFIEEIGFAEWPDGTLSGKYRFRHALYQNVLYEHIAQARRVRFHRTIGEREETGYDDHVGQQAAALARHFEQGRDWERAGQYYKQAGENAVSRHAPQEAVPHFHKALDLMAGQSATQELQQNRLDEVFLQMELAKALSATQGYTAPEVERAYTRALELSQQCGETKQVFSILRGLGEFYDLRGDFEEADELCTRLLSIAEQQNNSGFLVEAHYLLGEIAWFRGDFLGSRTHFEHGLSLYNVEQHREHAFLYGQDPGVGSHADFALVQWALGYPEKAVGQIETALTLARSLSHPFSLAYALCFAALVYQFRREWQTVQEYVQEAVSVASEYGFRHWQMMATLIHSRILVEQGKVDDGMSQLMQNVAMYQDSGAEGGSSAFLAGLGELHIRSGRREEGLRTLEAGFEMDRRNGERYYKPELYRLKGECALESGEADTAAEYFQSGLELARQQQAKSWELRLATSLSRLWLQQEKKTEAQELLTPVYDWFTEGFETADLQEAKALLDQIQGQS